jgi:hypothetical protein
MHLITVLGRILSVVVNLAPYTSSLAPFAIVTFSRNCKLYPIINNAKWSLFTNIFKKCEQCIGLYLYPYIFFNVNK